MFIGIDVGGTYTDAVLVTRDKVLCKTKFPTMHDNLTKSLLTALDQIISGVDTSSIKRIVISTTLITNLIAEEKYDPVALVLEPGPGMNPVDYPFKEKTYIVNGGIDFRGREIIPLVPEQVDEIITDIKSSDIKKIAVVGKFSCRNNEHENEIGKRMEQAGLDFELGHRVSGQLNFLRRTATTMLTVATRKEHSEFIENVKQAVLARNINAPIFILKADGGTLPVEASKKAPVETIFSGPAASILGAMSLTPKGSTSVVVDIGGTTSDLALILDGGPLLASKGVAIKGNYTSIVSYAVRSVPIGGDSTVDVKDGRIILLPERKGPAFCFGGPVPTPTDAMLVLGHYGHGDPSAAEEGLKPIAEALGTDVKGAANAILDKVTDGIVDAINDIFLSWEQEPAYRVWELLNPTTLKPRNVVGVGGAAPGIIPEVARKMGCNPIIPEHAEVANAIGAAVAEPTVKVTVRIDTGVGTFSVAENGSQAPLTGSASFREENAIRLAKESLREMADSINIKTDDIEVIHSEVFNVIRGFTTAGRIYDVVVQTPRKILTHFEEEGVGE